MGEDFEDKIRPESDDQSGLAYLLLMKKWGDKIYVENGYYFEGYWVEIVGRFENITEECRRVEAAARGGGEPGIREGAEAVCNALHRVPAVQWGPQRDVDGGDVL